MKHTINVISTTATWIHRIACSLLVMFIFLLSSCEMYEPDQPGLLVPKTVDEDPLLPSIFVNGARLHSEAFGPPDSTMIVVLHGGPGGDYRHLLNCKVFAQQGYRVVFYDQRGSGLSQRFPKSSYSVEVMTAELDGVISHYRTSPRQKVYLFGHSWGAMLATAYINEHPTRIAGAVLAEPGGLIWQDVADYMKRTFDVAITSESLNDALYLDQFIAVKNDQHALLDYKHALRSTTMSGKGNPLGDEGNVPMWRSGAVINGALRELGDRVKPDWTTNLHQFTTKVLFMYSERNRAYGYDFAVKVSAAYPNVQLFKVYGAGHEMMHTSTGWSNVYPAALTYFNKAK